MPGDNEEYEIIHDPDERVEEDNDFHPELQWSREEKRWVILGALKGTLLIASAYIIGLGLLIFLLLKLWS